MVANILGNGLDIPLLGLREACKENNNGELCELFTDESYKISQCFLLSTSQVKWPISTLLLHTNANAISKLNYHFVFHSIGFTIALSPCKSNALHFSFVHFSLLKNLETNSTSILIFIHRSLVLPTVSWATDRSHQKAMDARIIRVRMKLSFAFLHSIRPTIRVHRDTQNHYKIHWIWWENCLNRRRHHRYFDKGGIKPVYGMGQLIINLMKLR